MELADRLPFCPRCAYPFTGLPEAHQCPECGLPYDAESRMWVGSTRMAFKAEWVSLIVGIVFPIIFITIFLLTAIIVQPYRKWFIMFAVLHAALLPFSFYQWRRRQQAPPQFLAIMADGVWYRIQLSQHKFLEWKHVRDIDPIVKRKSLTMFFTNRSVWSVMVDSAFESEGDLRTAAAEMERRVQRHICADSQV